MIVIRHRPKRKHRLRDVRPRDALEPQAMSRNPREMLIVRRALERDAGSLVDEYEVAHKSAGIVEPTNNGKTSIF